MLLSSSLFWPLLSTAYMTIHTITYLYHYGWKVFLYLCDIALFLTYFTYVFVNNEQLRRLLYSTACVGILLPQIVWNVDFVINLLKLESINKLKISTYMFNPRLKWYLKLLSLFHAWLPMLLVYYVKREGYDLNAWICWVGLSFVINIICYFVSPKPSSDIDSMIMPVNINYVFGLESDREQKTFSKPVYWFLFINFVNVAASFVTHIVLIWLF